MKQKLYEIWEHPGSQTWKVFTDVTQEIRTTLLQTGWQPVTQYQEDETGEGEIGKLAAKKDPAL